VGVEDADWEPSFCFVISFRYQGQIGAALVLGGFDASGPHLFTVAPHGSTDKLPYVTMGSGSLAAMSVFESGWEKDMTVSTVIECPSGYPRRERKAPRWMA